MLYRACILLAITLAPAAALRTGPFQRSSRVRGFGDVRHRGVARRGPRRRAPVAASLAPSPHGADWRGDCFVPSWDGDERDGCGVGFIAQQSGAASHDVVSKALRALGCMEHRGGCLADESSGDGAGIMTQVPWELLRDWVSAEDEVRCGVGQIFLPQDAGVRADVMKAVESLMERNQLNVLGWRDVPVDPAVLGPEARENMPHVAQIIVRSDSAVGKALERQLYLVRRRIVPDLVSAGVAQSGVDETYVASMSSRTIVYKGMMRSESLAQFYQDLGDERYASAFAVYHRRFSTNTSPKWRLAQPMRMLGHNGEINTLLGNINWQRAREANLEDDESDDKFFRDDEDSYDYSSSAEEMEAAAEGKVCDVDDLWDARNTHRLVNVCNLSSQDDFEATVSNANSDSANLDAVMEMFVRSGKPPAEALMLLVPEAYDLKASDREDVKAFYKYYEGLQEAWDGPALLVFCDGTTVGAKLDRNGLRPARFLKTKSGLVCFMSETGVVDLEGEEVVERGRLGPGEMVAVNFRQDEFLHNWELKEQIASRFPYGEWLESATFREKAAYPGSSDAEERVLALEPAQDGSMVKLQTLLGWGVEDVDMQLSAMATTGKEATYCMGDDAPLAVLSEKPHVAYDYLKQRFAQVTNPAIDPLREGSVMSLNVALGKKGNLLQPSEENAKMLHLRTPVLHAEDVDAIAGDEALKAVTLDTTYDLSAGPDGLRDALLKLGSQAVAAVSRGAQVLVLSDKALLDADLKAKTYVPPLLAVGAVHHRLIDEGLRMKASLVSETGQAWSTHHLACLVGYGASAVHPYLAHLAVRQLARRNGADEAGALGNFRAALEGGMLKIMSKIGISMLSSYSGAQIFEAVGLSKDVIDLALRGTPSRVGGMSLEDMANEANLLYRNAFPELHSDPEGESKAPRQRLENYGFNKFTPRAEYHHNTPKLSNTLHKAVRSASQGDYAKGVDHYNIFMESLKVRPVTTLRDLVELAPAGGAEAVALDSVEPVEDIMRRFVTGGMSLGALSREAHETLAIAMNRIGGKSNSGEGGEDPRRWQPLGAKDLEEDRCTSGAVSPLLKGLREGDSASSKIKQVASGRFGVTPQYLRSGEQLEIKVAQGAKPGEGGQLPGAKIDDYIASLRASTPGVTLISPPPHHDIYSIEDLAQLIFDLKAVHPKAGVSVKLVSEVGIGTVACGVAKANADVIQVSGHDGGTGASPLSSIKHAGSPWELGLTEVHQSLLENGLRGKVTLRVDGGIKTGWDVVAAAAMGAEEFGFGTIAMIAEGCVMARVCHLNTCPVGVTTQKPELREKFPGTPDHVVQYFNFVADEARAVLAALGKTSLDEVVGDLSVLRRREEAMEKVAKTRGMDASAILRGSVQPFDKRRPDAAHPVGARLLDDELLELPELRELLAAAGDEAAKPRTVEIARDVVNTDRCVGGRLSGEIAEAFGAGGVAGAGHGVELTLSGTAGQSFGAFNVAGLRLRLRGDANDYVGKSMCGGVVEILGHPGEPADAEYRAVAGNTCLYGATGGSAFIAGAAGERFGVRNSGAEAVVEGVGDHLSEYQTGGTVIVLGDAGVNIGSGMTGGAVYLLGAKDAEKKVNGEYLDCASVQKGSGADKYVRSMVEEHLQRTGSKKAEAALADWDQLEVLELLPKGNESPFKLFEAPKAAMRQR